MRKRQKKEIRRRVILPEKRHEAGTPAVFLVDGMNLAYIAYYAYTKLRFRGKSVSVLFGLISMLKSWLTKNQWRPHKLVIVWDGMKHPKRLSVWPKYKSHRLKKRDPAAYQKFLKQIKATRKLLRLAGIPQIWNKKVEGDDMIYIASQYFVSDRPIYIISCDKDFDQLVNRDITIYNPRKDAINVPGLVPVLNHGVNVNQIVDFHCLVGDDSDNIPGIKGIGQARAARFLEIYGSIQEYLKGEDDFPGLGDRERLIKVYKRNRCLIDLKYFNRKYNKKAKIQYYKGQRNPEFNEQDFKDYCKNRGLKSFVTKQFIDFIKSLCQKEL